MVQDITTKAKNPHAQALGAMGGKARRAKVSKPERVEQARKAAQARWDKAKGRP